MQSVLNYIGDNQSRFVDELSEYLRFPSISAQPEHKKDIVACSKWIAAHCRDIGLKTEVCKTAGQPIVVARTPRARNSRKPHYLIYGHYDVQPPDPLELWNPPPFEPQIANGNIYARGSTDNKGQHMAHLKAVEAYLKTGTDLPCDLTFILEGEEEVGSSNLTPFVQKRKKEFACAGVVVSDTGMPSPKHPAVTYSLRGVMSLEVRLDGPARDLHSGVFGGSIENPAMALCQLIAKCRNDKGKVLVPGFYDDVEKLSKYEREQMAKVPHNDRAYLKMLGSKQVFGEAGFSATELRTARPTFEINGITSGYQGEGSKTIVPSYASCKITIRLVPNQKPQKVLRQVKAHLKKVCPPSVKLTIEGGHEGDPYIVAPKSPQVQAGLDALKASFGREPIVMREGGSIPIINDFKKILGVDTLLLGLALPDDNLHSPNEKFNLEQLRKGMLMSAHLWQRLGELG
jgi:acetylornithine deacetylase/succinyl-diaminopimelate desuccinylase-like protein